MEGIVNRFGTHTANAKPMHSHKQDITQWNSSLFFLSNEVCLIKLNKWNSAYPHEWDFIPIVLQIYCRVFVHDIYDFFVTDYTITKNHERAIWKTNITPKEE